MSDETDEQLMHAYREGNARAFELLLARHERKVWNFLRRSVGDPSLAEDLLQEVFLRVKARAEWKVNPRPGLRHRPQHLHRPRGRAMPRRALAGRPTRAGRGGRDDA
jgi:hypothetical protein